MKILFVIDQFRHSKNGTTASASRMLRSLQSRGHQVRVVCGDDPGEEYAVPTGIKRYPFLYQLCKRQGMFLAHPDDAVLEREIRRSDLVHFMLPFELSRRGKRIADALEKPSTAAFHLQPENITSTLRLGKVEAVNELLYRTYRRFYDRFTHVHCPSKMIRSNLLRRGYRAQLHVISNGVAEEFRPRQTKKPARFAGRKLVLMVGRLSREKRQDVLIDAVARSRHETSIQLVLAGQGPMQGKLARRGEQLTHRPEIGFFNKDALIDLMNVCELYVHASDVEIEAIACLEAMACGLVPIISDSKKSATGQFALSEANRFTSGDPRSLARQIDRLLEDGSLRKQLSRHYLRYADWFSLQKSVDGLEAMFKQACDDHGARRP